MMASSFRANLTPHSIPLPDGSGQYIPTGSFCAVHLADAHRDSVRYPDPLRWDPSLFLVPTAEFEVRVGKLGFVSWGGRRRLCLGKRLARVEISIAVAFFVGEFDLAVVGGAAVPENRPDSAGIMEPRERVLLELRRWEKGL